MSHPTEPALSNRLPLGGCSRYSVVEPELGAVQHRPEDVGQRLGAACRWCRRSRRTARAAPAHRAGAGGSARPGRASRSARGYRGRGPRPRRPGSRCSPRLVTLAMSGPFIRARAWRIVVSPSVGFSSRLVNSSTNCSRDDPGIVDPCRRRGPRGSRSPGRASRRAGPARACGPASRRTGSPGPAPSGPPRWSGRRPSSP